MTQVCRKQEHKGISNTKEKEVWIQFNAGNIGHEHVCLLARGGCACICVCEHVSLCVSLTEVRVSLIEVRKGE